MRAAICVSGHARQYAETFSELKRNLLDLNESFEFDFFIHTWNRVNWYIDQPFDLTALVTQYAPKSIAVEKDTEWAVQPILDIVGPHAYHKGGTHGEHILGMYYSVWRAWQLMSDYAAKNAIEYDVVVRYRPDLIISDPVCLCDHLSEIDTTVFLPHQGCGLPIEKPTGTDLFSLPLRGWRLPEGFMGIPGVCDCFAYGSPSVMAAYCGVYPNMMNLVRKYKIFGPETLLYQQLEPENGIKIGNIFIRWTLLREGGHTDSFSVD